MLIYLFQRLGLSALLVLALLSVVFFVIQLAPGDPMDRLLDPDLDAAGRAAQREALGLDRPLPVQYARWLGGVVLRGDFGRSLRQHRPVTKILGEAIPPTLLLTLSAYFVHMATAVAAGVTMARRRGRPDERALNVVGLSFYAMPAFWLGEMLIIVFCLNLGWFPAGGLASPATAHLSGGRKVLDVAHHLVLPVFLLGFSSAIGTARYLRNSLLEVLGQEYIVAARAKGLPEHTILWKHALRNALLPMITLAGLSLPFLLGGAVVTEVVFAWPGMGRVTVEAIFARDYPVIMGTTALAAVLAVAGNLLADLAYGLVDPRVRLARGRAA